MSDLIDRQRAIDALIDALAWTWSGTWSEKSAIDAIKNLPSAQPDVPDTNVGKWIKVGDNSYRCSVCGEVSCCNGNFCPDCGADMRERRNDDN